MLKEKRRNGKKMKKKDIYEINERVISSSRKLNIDKLKSDIEKNFKDMFFTK